MTIHRLQHFKGGGTRLLDVGAGEGWGQAVARYLGMKYYCVEAQPRLAGDLQRKGAVVAPSVADLDCASCSFDLIVLRHSLEHFLQPVWALRTLRRCLAPNGTIYVAVPNLKTQPPKKGFRTYCLRPVHISYFTAGTLSFALSQAGLAGHVKEHALELWVLAGCDPTPHDPCSEARRNTEYLRNFVHDRRRQDWRRILRLLLRRIFYWPGVAPEARWSVRS